MGKNNSKKSPSLEAASLFSKNERDQINKLFQDIAGSHSAVSFSREQFQLHATKYLSRQYIYRLHDEMANVISRKPRMNAKVSYEAFVVSLMHILKGSLSQRGHIVRRLASDNRETTASEELINLIEEFITGYVKAVHPSKAYETWRLSTSHDSNRKFARVLLQELFQKDNAAEHQHSYIPAQHFDEESIESWLAKTPLISHMMDTVLGAIFPVLEKNEQGTNSPSIPECVGASWDKHSTVLDIPSLLLLNHHIPVELSHKWRLLFCNRLHGESFSTLVKHIRNKGPSIVIIKDKEGYVFGGFADCSWEVTPTFYGGSRCFLFSLSPQIGIYDCTGLNENYMYLNINQQTLPNGLGFGGQFNYFGLWLNKDYGTGHSKAGPLCTTYNSPQLSQRTDFEVESIEIWGVGPESTTEITGDKPSILDIDLEAQAMLAMVGKGPHSEGLRNHDATAQSPGEKELPFF